MATQPGLAAAVMRVVDRLEGDPAVAQYFSRKLARQDGPAPDADAMRRYILASIQAEMESVGGVGWGGEAVTAVGLTRPPGFVVWLTGLSAAGKSSIARKLERNLLRLGKHPFVLDGDNIRRGLCSDLGFSPHDRKENIRRVGEVARLFAEAGLNCITALISPYREERAMVRRMFQPGQFIEVFVNAPIEVCEQRDPKGLYAKARANQIKEFTGVSAPYEPPEHPEIVVQTDRLTVAEAVRKILAHLDLANP